MQRLISEHKQVSGAGEGEEVPLELEAAASERRASNRALLLGLSQLAQADGAVAAALEKKMSEAGIQPPEEEEDAETGY